MTHNPQKISLGFTPQEFPAGVHVCQIIGHDEERLEAMLKFLLSGLQAGERASCFSENLPETMLADFLARHGISCQEKRVAGALLVAGTR